METDKIFEDKERIDFNFANHLDDLFNFYDRSAKPEFTKVRDIINEWFIDYPQSEKSELKTRFRKAFSPAFFELFIYQLFTKQGFTLTLHPQIQGTNKAPDFLAEKGDLSFYIEAKEATDTSNIILKQPLISRLMLSMMLYQSLLFLITGSLSRNCKSRVLSNPVVKR